MKVSDQIQERVNSFAAVGGEFLAPKTPRSCFEVLFIRSRAKTL